MSIVFTMNHETFQRHKDNVAKFFEPGQIPTIQEGDTFNLNYNIQLNATSEMVEKLRALVDIAEDDATNFKFKLDERIVQEYAEIGRLMLDLKHLAEANSHRDLCEMTE